jgi:hypothetical protein
MVVIGADMLKATQSCITLTDNLEVNSKGSTPLIPKPITEHGPDPVPSTSHSHNLGLPPYGPVRHPNHPALSLTAHSYLWQLLTSSWKKETRTLYRILVGNTIENFLLGDRKSVGDDSIKLYLPDICCEDMNWIEVAQDYRTSDGKLQC